MSIEFQHTVYNVDLQSVLLVAGAVVLAVILGVLAYLLCDKFLTRRP